ncbi:hypothetical protein PV326_009982, partial [Microctonus aethiopoides]
FHELIGALNKIAISTESKSCKNNEQCLKIQQCMDKICVDPCPGSCGIDALCYTINHTLLCECPRCYYGDPNDKCQSFTEALDPSKDCENSTSCGMSEKCILDLCRNPCPGSCGINAICTVLKHEPNCRCPKCYEGDALIKCEPYQGLRRFTCQWVNFQSRIPCENNTGCLNSQICESKKCIDPCPGKCGTNALCNVNNHNLNCSCARCYEGDPQKICTQFPETNECKNNTQCLKTQYCLTEVCRNPCPGSCGIDASCHVINHTLSCICPDCYEGDAYEQCTPLQTYQMSIQPIN